MLDTSGCGLYPCDFAEHKSEGAASIPRFLVCR